jgi:hypothetical protein
MIDKQKVSARPPEKKNEHENITDELALAFIKEGSLDNTKQQVKKLIHHFPWENARDDVFKTFNLRLPEEYAVKLDYLSMKIKSSKHAICMNIVKKEIDRLLTELTN